MIPKFTKSLTCGALRLSLLWAVLGCGADGPKIVPVTGQVLLDGAPVTKGTVTFISPSGFGASAPLQSDGRFQLTSQYGNGVPPEQYRVAILPSAPAPSSALAAAAMEGRAVEASPSPVPPRYSDCARSGLTADTRAATDFIFRLHHP